VTHRALVGLAHIQHQLRAVIGDQAALGLGQRIAQHHANQVLSIEIHARFGPRPV
jgi:erythromycin esterase-like protein